MTRQLLHAQNGYQLFSDFGGVQANQAQRDILAEKSDKDETFPHFGEVDILVFPLVEKKGEIVFSYELGNLSGGPEIGCRKRG